MLSLEERVIVVTGAAGGIGAASARLFAQIGATVALLDLDAEGAAGVADEIANSGYKAASYGVDITDEESVAKTMAAIMDRFGRIDGAFNNAAVTTASAELHEMSAALWRRTVDVDLTGTFLCLKHEIGHMLATGGGTIVNTSSGFGIVAMRSASDYVAAKHGVVGLTRAAAAEYATRGIRVNAVLPGLIKTPMVDHALALPEFASQFETLAAAHPIGRPGEPSEIANAAAWLLSSLSSFVTGAMISVDGGYTAL